MATILPFGRRGVVVERTAPKTSHIIPLGTLVEVKKVSDECNGLRLFVVKHKYDDEVPVYTLSFRTLDDFLQLEKDIDSVDPITHNIASWMAAGASDNGYVDDYLTVIRLPKEQE